MLAACTLLVQAIRCHRRPAYLAGDGDDQHEGDPLEHRETKNLTIVVHGDWLSVLQSQAGRVSASARKGAMMSMNERGVSRCAGAMPRRTVRAAFSDDGFPADEAQYRPDGARIRLLK